MTLIPPTQLTANGIKVGMRSMLTLSFYQSHPLNSQHIFSLHMAFASSNFITLSEIKSVLLL